MGLIDSAISGAMEAVGSGMMDAGNFFLKGGYSVWGNFSKVAMRYVQQQPESLGAWQVVTGSVYTLSTGIAASLSVLFFVLGWMRNSVEIRNNFSIDEVFKFCIRYVLTAGLIVNALSLISSVSECATAVVAVIYEEEGLENQEAPDDLFERGKGQPGRWRLRRRLVKRWGGGIFRRRGWRAVHHRMLGAACTVCTFAAV